VLIFQNIWVAANYRKLDDGFIKRWITAQIATAVICLPLAAHLLPILRNSSKWTWLRTAGIADGAAIFAGLIDWKYILCFTLILCWALMCERMPSVAFAWGLKRMASDPKIGFAALWMILPPLCAYLATVLLKSSLLDARYMLLSLPGLFILMGCFANTVRCSGRRVFLPLFAICLYLMMVSMPCWRSEGRFSYRIPHDWRDALAVMSRQVMPGDAVLLRSGFIKENWVPDTNDATILKYVKAPLRGWYFNPGEEGEGKCSMLNDQFSISKGGEERGGIPVYNLTYSYEKAFAPYLEKVLANVADARRIWIIGVNPPNTNYPIERTAGLFKHRRKLFEKSFGGVHLSLLK
jgi:hypothetical protein